LRNLVIACFFSEKYFTVMIPAEKRTVVHMDLDTFFVSVERLHNSSLNGKPVIIGGMSDRGVVAGCSYEARRYGVRSAMPMKMARILCPDAVYIRGDLESYSRYSRMVTEIIAEKAPVVEKASIDEHYLDITGMDRFFGALKWTHELREHIIRNTGLPISLGLSVNKTVSKIATGIAKPNGELQVPFQDVKPFLDPLSISKIPMIGQKTFHLLRSMGIATIKTLSAMPPEMVERVLGKNGIIIWKKANGIDPSPVQTYQERKSVSTETTFDTDTTDVAMLNDLIAK
jgi:DNA polymerase IV